ncbi:MAG: biotin/lipoyl-binding protein [Candidatus Kuenenia sp.]|nr:biotin/lipoyl-binding protein [Candidatus Kuenenia hertensis]
MKRLRITVEGKVYEVIVEILDEEISKVAHPEKQTPSHGQIISQKPFPADKKQGDITSPIPGKVSTIFVQKGQYVKEGERLMVLEAMKMNNYVYAPHDGKIDAIYVKSGDTVEEDQLLLNIS